MKNFRIDVLDLYARNHSLLEEYKTTYNAYKKAEKHHAELLEQQKTAGARTQLS